MALEQLNNKANLQGNELDPINPQLVPQGHKKPPNDPRTTHLTIVIKDLTNNRPIPESQHFGHLPDNRLSIGSAVTASQLH